MLPVVHVLPAMQKVIYMYMYVHICMCVHTGYRRYQVGTTACRILLIFWPSPRESNFWNDHKNVLRRQLTHTAHTKKPPTTTTL